MSKQTLQIGAQFAFEKDETCSRLFWVFWFNTTPFGAAQLERDTFQHSEWKFDANFLQLPLSKMQIAALDQQESLQKGKWTEFEQGFVGTGVYFENMERLCQQNK